MGYSTKLHDYTGYLQARQALIRHSCSRNSMASHTLDGQQSKHRECSSQCLQLSKSSRWMTKPFTLQSVCMVDPSPNMGHDHRGLKPSHSRDGQSDVRSADQVRNDRRHRCGLPHGTYRVMLFPGLAFLAQHKLAASEKSCRLPVGLSSASSSLKLQWVSPERAPIQHQLPCLERDTLALKQRPSCAKDAGIRYRVDCDTTVYGCDSRSLFPGTVSACPVDFFVLCDVGYFFVVQSHSVDVSCW